MAPPPSVWPRRKATRVSVRVIHVQVEGGWEGEDTGKSEGLGERLSVSEYEGEGEGEGEYEGEGEG